MEIEREYVVYDITLIITVKINHFEASKPDCSYGTYMI